jgi:hypothetical protein
MRRFAYLLSCLFVFSAFAAQAAAAVCDPNVEMCLGKACGIAGESKLDKGGANIIACVCVGTTCGTLQWKAMTSPDVTCTGGMYITSIIDGVRTCGTLIEDKTCPPGQKIAGISAGVPYCVAF